MKTITFYSYKGGVGRSLALYNTAVRLSGFNKKLIVIDFDLEAPGLDSKFAGYLQKPIEKGIIDYIYEFAVNKRHTDIKDYIIDLKINGKENVGFIPAGNTNSSEYWKKLSQINWWNLFYEDNALGIDFFFNMKKQIGKTFAPDYILIDTRTGITEMSSLTMSILAEKVVVLSANNKENIDGCVRVVNALTRDEDSLTGKDKEIHFVLTRIPQPETPDEKQQCQVMINQKENMIKNVLGQNRKQLSSFTVIHSDRNLETNEFHNYDLQAGVSKSFSDNEYHQLYNNIIKTDITVAEESQIQIMIKYNQRISKAFESLSVGNPDFLYQINDIIKDYPDFPDAYRLLGHYYYNDSDYEMALEKFNLAISKGGHIGNQYLSYVASLSRLGRYDEALKQLEEYRGADELEQRYMFIRINHYKNHDKEIDIEAISELIEENPAMPFLYNCRATFYRYYREYVLALKDVYRALELDTEFAIAYTTLAEIKYDMGDKDEFYRNLEMALKFDLDLKILLTDECFAIYKAESEDEKFQNLLKKYNCDDELELIKKTEVKLSAKQYT